MTYGLDDVAGGPAVPPPTMPRDAWRRLRADERLASIDRALARTRAL